MTPTAEASTVPAVHPTGAALGADIGNVDLNDDLDAQQVSAIRAAWNDHLVLRFRGQESLTLEGLAAFSRHFGTLDKRPTVSFDMSREHDALPPDITVISNVKVEGKPLGALGDGEAVWHADMTYNERPPKGACLYAVEVPPSGGNTHFSNMYLAYETLDPVLREQIRDLRCIHDASRNSAGELRLGFVDNTDPRQTVGASHPLVSVHEGSGRRCLLLGRRRNAYVVGMDLADSEALLDRLWAHATRPELTWTQVWKVGDVMMWDNRCTMHRRDAFDPHSRRLMYRTQIAGGTAD
ncbi:Pentalenolactone F synthase [Variovorax sp. SRS16]|uniref:TauD/TfdA dioxygenase family protein n=1 Tax=Variovorax sp. SRS16 TaxID=282217 RepID=UPI001317D1C7|nr:TauD/TfdA family dioxygenase [Variovorax sp. SRS16]VTU30644.1 Pentalenolactone F synthase [Variovorax sp. SRS16]